MPLLFKKKGSPPPAGPSDMPHKPGLVIEIGHGGGPPPDDAPPEEGGDMPSGDVTCPNCGCEFDPATGEIKGGYDNDSPPTADASGEDEPE